MLIVKLTVAREAFIDSVNEIAEWLDREQIVSPVSTYSGDKVLRSIRLGFSETGEGRRFAERFGGEVMPLDQFGFAAASTLHRKPPIAAPAAD